MSGAFPSRETGQDTASGQVQQALVVQRILWMALLVGPLAFFLVVVFVLWPGGFAAQPEVARLLFPVAIGVLIIGLTMGVLLRRRIARSGHDGSVELNRYATGNILFWAICEGSSLLGLVTMLMYGQLWPAVLIPAIASAAHLLTFPAGVNVRQNGDTL